MARYFFDCSAEAHDDITALFDFVWPTAVAMWNLRWQVQGYVGATGDDSVPSLRNRFSHGSGIDGANLNRACLEVDWDVQQQEFGRTVLVNVIAIYEAWIDGLAATKALTI
jgi:hypothetical protein